MHQKHWIVSIVVVIALLIGQSTKTYAQNSRKIQTEEAKKEAKAKKKRERPRKVNSNQNKVRRNKRGSNREVRRTGKKDITGRKFRAKKTERATTFTAPQDPYAGRRIRTERSRAGATAAPVRSATPRVEKARTGDISGRKRIRTRSVSSARTVQYPSFDHIMGEKEERRQTEFPDQSHLRGLLELQQDQTNELEQLVHPELFLNREERLQELLGQASEQYLVNEG